MVISETIIDKRVYTAALLLSPGQCDEIVKAAEKHAKSAQGWSINRRHKDVPTTDFELKDLALEWAEIWQRDVLAPRIAEVASSM